MCQAVEPKPSQKNFRHNLTLTTFDLFREQYMSCTWRRAQQSYVGCLTVGLKGRWPMSVSVASVCTHRFMLNTILHLLAVFVCCLK